MPVAVIDDGDFIGVGPSGSGCCCSGSIPCQAGQVFCVCIFNVRLYHQNGSPVDLFNPANIFYEQDTPECHTITLVDSFGTIVGLANCNTIPVTVPGLPPTNLNGIITVGCDSTSAGLEIVYGPDNPGQLIMIVATADNFNGILGTYVDAENLEVYSGSSYLGIQLSATIITGPCSS